MVKDKPTGKESVPPARIGRCPVCQKRQHLRQAPFCGKRCAQLDLGRWLNGSYRITGHTISDDEA